MSDSRKNTQDQQFDFIDFNRQYNIKINDMPEWKLLALVDTKKYFARYSVNHKNSKETYTLLQSEAYQIKLSTKTQKAESVQKLCFHVFNQSGKSAFLIEVTDDQKQKKQFTFLSESDYQNCLTQMRKHGVCHQYFFSEKFIPTLKWKEYSFETHYDNRISQNYTKLFFEMQNLIQSALIKYNKEKEPILFISAGTGIALDLLHIKKTLGDQFNCFYAGFDLNKTSAEMAQKNLPEGHFECKALQDSESFFEKSNAIFSTEVNKQNPCRVVLFSGVLAKRIVENKRAALTYLQYAVRHADFIFIASHTETMIDPHAAKSTSLQKESASTASFEITEEGVQRMVPIYLYRVPSSEARVQAILKQSETRKITQNNIDLCGSANPLNDLMQLAQHAPTELHAATQLDLSFSYIKDEEIEKIAAIIEKSSFKQILTAPLDLAWSLKLQTLLPSKKHLVRADFPNEYTPHHASIPSLSKANGFAVEY